MCIRDSCIVTKTRHQSVIALSSGEAEFYAATSAIARSIGIQQMLRDWGIEVSISLGMDATAGITMITRQGLGKAKHINLQYLWAQEALTPNRITLHPKPADMFTKHLARAVIESLQTRLGYHWDPKPGN